MAENYVENGLELTNYLVTKHWDKAYDKCRKLIGGHKVDSLDHKSKERNDDSSPSPAPPSSSSSNKVRETPQSQPDQQGRSLPVRSLDPSGGAAFTGLPPAIALAAQSITERATAITRPNTAYSPVVGARRHQRSEIPEPDRDIDKDQTRDAISIVRRENQHSDRVLSSYEAENDDPIRGPASVLPDKYLWTVSETPASRHSTLRGATGTKRERILKDSSNSRRDSRAMASGYNDYYYGNTQYEGEGRARSAQPPRSRYYDDGDSDYDERSGKRSGARGRGWDDQYDDRYVDRVVEETERYRGPPVDRPYGVGRKENHRSDHDGPHGASAVTQYGRRSDGALDRQDRDSYVSQPKCRGRSDRDGSHSRPRSRSRSGDGERGEGVRGRIEDAFDTSGRGLGAGLAGAVIGGLAGRQFGQSHQQRDMLIGAVVGGLGANLAEKKYTQWKGDREEREEMRYDGRSRSHVRP